ncbi:hypothetical protein cce_2510 [Crocosphaera subtropica ATCC 51142]|uniref:Lipoprotein n=1 Tax=Crocosphaera subtropica (strain ATCC 51142 / BH68) TaxID=43989 RepID=B1WS72_CROS5|nr:hypothetical protein [Crocosphaera subtropica]ACB51858.1 hypothetical protein cce_2510 [Crocosphaera subtropica ATCC 51142]
MKLPYLILKKIFPLSLMLLIFPLASCQIEQEEQAQLPDVNVEPGQLPEYDIQGPDVDVGLTTRTVVVPKVVVIQDKETVEVPYIDVNVPGAENEERTITTEVQVPSGGYNLEIQGIYVVDNDLWVISRLTEENPNAPKADVRISDRVVINAPSMPVQQFIIGESPDGSYNEQYTFIDSRQQIASQLQSGKQLYGNQQQASR